MCVEVKSISSSSFSRLIVLHIDYGDVKCLQVSARQLEWKHSQQQHTTQQTIGKREKWNVTLQLNFCYSAGWCAVYMCGAQQRELWLTVCIIIALTHFLDGVIFFFYFIFTISHFHFVCLRHWNEIYANTTRTRRVRWEIGAASRREEKIVWVRESV